MRKRLFGVRPTNKIDVYVAAGTAIIAVFGFFGTLQEYKSEQELEKENDQ